MGIEGLPRTGASGMGDPPRRDRTVLYGIWAIVGSFFCFPLGLIMIVLSWQEARRAQRPPVLAIIAAVLLVVFTIINIKFVLGGGANQYLKR